MGKLNSHNPITTQLPLSSKFCDRSISIGYRQEGRKPRPANRAPTELYALCPAYYLPYHRSSWRQLTELITLAFPLQGPSWSLTIDDLNLADSDDENMDSAIVADCEATAGSLISHL